MRRSAPGVLCGRREDSAHFLRAVPSVLRVRKVSASSARAVVAAASDGTGAVALDSFRAEVRRREVRAPRGQRREGWLDAQQEGGSARCISSEGSPRPTARADFDLAGIVVSRSRIWSACRAAAEAAFGLRAAAAPGEQNGPMGAEVEAGRTGVGRQPGASSRRNPSTRFQQWLRRNLICGATWPHSHAFRGLDLAVIGLLARLLTRGCWRRGVAGSAMGQ